MKWLGFMTQNSLSGCALMRTVKSRVSGEPSGGSAGPARESLRPRGDSGFWDLKNTFQVRPNSSGGRMKTTRTGFAMLVLVCLFPMNLIVRAQGIGSSAEIRGTVTDPTGATVPKAIVTVEDNARGVHRTNETDADGSYRLTGLPPSTYTVSVQLSGFQTEAQKDLVVNIGQTL